MRWREKTVLDYFRPTCHYAVVSRKVNGVHLASQNFFKRLFFSDVKLSEVSLLDNSKMHRGRLPITFSLLLFPLESFLEWLVYSMLGNMPEEIWSYDRTTTFRGGKHSFVRPRRGSVPWDKRNRQWGVWIFQKTLYPGVRNHFLIQNKKPVDWIIPIGAIVWKHEKFPI